MTRHWLSRVPAFLLILTATSAFAAPPATTAAPAPKAAPVSSIVKTTPKGEVKFELHAKDSAELFDKASEKWNKSLDVPKLRVDLKKIADGKPVSEEKLTELKAVRKDGNVLRGTYVLLDKNHEAPAKLDQVVTKFGKMNDAIAAGDKDLQKHYARATLKALDEKALKKEIKEFDPATHKSFEKHMDEEVANLDKGLEKKTLLAPEFHDMRKSLTKVLNILTLDPDSRKDPKIEALYQKVLSTQTAMGEIHDDLSAKAMHGDIKYDTYEVKMPAKMRADLRDILDTLG